MKNVYCLSSRATDARNMQGSIGLTQPMTEVRLVELCTEARVEVQAAVINQPCVHAQQTHPSDRPFIITD